VVVGVVINMAAGALRYSPLLFAKPWMAEVGIAPEQMRPKGSAAYRGYALSILASIVIVLTLAILAQLTGATSAAEGAGLGLLGGIGFVATTQAANYSFESRSRRLYLINVGYSVVGFVLFGVLLAVWQ
jgi:hypothetical protein